MLEFCVNGYFVVFCCEQERYIMCFQFLGDGEDYIVVEVYVEYSSIQGVVIVDESECIFEVVDWICDICVECVE